MALLVIALLCAALIALTNAVGYMGGGQDDGRYVAAADCWVEMGACLPASHWSGRWPIFAPIALVFEMFGRTRATVGLWPALCSIVALFLAGLVARSLAGRKAALLAVVLVALTPAFSRQLTMPSVEAFELCMMLGATLCVIRWERDRSVRWAFLIGLCIGIGFAARETAVAWTAMVVVAALACGIRPDAKAIAAVACGAALPFLIELAVYWLAAGDPFLRLKLSLGHGRIPSTELAASVDVTKSPILNPDYIGGWRREPGLEVHWLVDGPLNLALNALAGLSVLVVPPLLVWTRKRVDREAWRRCMALAAGAAVHVVLINYVFAMDPKARVFLPALTLLNIAMAALFAQLWSARLARPIVATLASAHVLLGLLMLAGFNRPGEAQRIAEQWLREHPGDIEGDAATKSAMKLSPMRAEIVPLGSGRSHVLLYTSSECGSWRAARNIPADALSIIDARSMSYFGQSSGLSAWICLFKYERAVPPAMLKPDRISWRP